MQGFCRVALQGMPRSLLAPLLSLAPQITISGIPAYAAAHPAAGRFPIARIGSIPGTKALLSRQDDWSKVTRLDTPLCAR